VQSSEFGALGCLIEDIEKFGSVVEVTGRWTKDVVHVPLVVTQALQRILDPQPDPLWTYWPRRAWSSSVGLIEMLAEASHDRHGGHGGHGGCF
jgi:hypothetical protein